MKKYLRLVALLLLVAFKASSTHIVGGDITVKWVSGNDFQVTLKFYRDCNAGNADFDATVTCGVFDLSTNVMQQQFTMPLILRDTLNLGDSCYSPPNLCVEEGIFQSTVTIPNNPNGYYISWLRCCRNSLIQNIVNPLSSGMVFYCEIPDPALQNSTPVFGSYPNAYFCVNVLNTRVFTCTDINGDSLVYSLEIPLDCDPTSGCSSNPIPPPGPGPYGTITWQTPYSLANILGDPLMAITQNTGILTVTPPTLGVFVFAVRVKEYRNGNKIGEIRRDIQYQVLPCAGNNPPFFTQPTTFSYNLLAGDTLCFPVAVTDPNNDTLFLTASSEVFSTSPDEPAVTWSNVNGHGSAQSTFCIKTNCNNIRSAPYHVNFIVRDSSCYGGTPVPLGVDIYVLPPSDGNIDSLVPNVFTPNGDGRNDYFKVNAKVNYCWDNFSVKIYDRWGLLVYQSNDFFFNWDGKYNGKSLSQGVYYYYLEANFKNYSFRKKGFIHLLR